MQDLADGMSWRTFTALLSGLSPRSVWRMVCADEPVHLTGDAARQAIADFRST